MKVDVVELRAKIEQEIAENKILVDSLISKGDYLDEDGYPTEDAIEIIRLWHWDDIGGWFNFIEGIWHLRSWGWSQGEQDHDWDKSKKVYRYNISTAGWSGNEDLIRAMENNDMLWHLTWAQSRRGGHYIFELRD